MKIFNVILVLLICLVGCKTSSPDTSTYTAIIGATIIDLTNDSPLEEGVLLIKNGRVVNVGTKENVTIPDNATIHDFTGKFIIPGIINTHGHVGDVKGIEGGYYSRENIIDNLSIYARYGITTVVSLGGDREEAVALRAVVDTVSKGRARLYIAGAVINGKTTEDIAEAVRKNHQMGVDFMKIRVDDNIGTSPKMPYDLSIAAIREAHELGYKIATHIYYLEDAKKLLEAGSDMIAHSVRDLPVDEPFIDMMKEKKVCYCPTFTRELSTYVYEDTASFFSDPFFQQEYDSLTIQSLKDPVRQQKIRENKNAQRYKQQLPVAMSNLKKLSANGVTIVFGTDSGMPARFMGYFEHLEMSMMAEAGLTPEQIIRSATKDAAVCMGLADVGDLQKGSWADFVVLNADPLSDIMNTRKIHSVFIGGHQVQR